MSLRTARSVDKQVGILSGADGVLDKGAPQDSMLRINVRRSAAGATRYYTGTLSHAEYLSESGSRLGRWGGKAALWLGLEGVVLPEDFLALCENRDPVTGEQLTLRTKAQRRVGYDLDFHPPKSVSMMHALGGDGRIRSAVERSAQVVMERIEVDAKARVRRDGFDADRPTENLIWASFTHELSRPVGGVPDPHLHVHCFVFNATYDPVDHAWKAAQFGDIKREGPFYQALFHHELARELEALGYDLTWIGDHFEIAGISETTIEKFSRRTEQIEAENDLQGITQPKARSQTGARTREAKADAAWTAGELRRAWEERLDAQERGRFTPPERAAHAYRRSETDPALLEQPLTYAITSCFERLSVVDEVQLLTAAMRIGGRIDPGQLRERIRTHPGLLKRQFDGRTVYTTEEVLQEEERVVNWVKRGHGTVPPLSGSAALPSREADEQAVARYHILSSRDRVTGIIGKPGTGKTTLMKSTIEAIEASIGKSVVILAPTAETGRGTLREAGFPQADTVEHLLSSRKLHEHARNGVWWVDEAGLLSLRDMARLTELAEDLNARIILSGDTQQHRSVRRGDALRILLAHGQLKVARLGRIRRQSGLYREAVDHLSEHRLLEAFQVFDRMGALVEIDSFERHEVLAKEYLQAVQEGASALVVSPTHAEGRAVTALVRAGLKQTGQLADERLIPTLNRVDLLEADAARPINYQRGWVLEFVKPIPGYAVGQRVQIQAVEPDGVRVTSSQGPTDFIEVARYWDRLQVFEPRMTPIAIGERIRLTKNGRALSGRRLHNSSLHTITGFTPEGDLVLDHHERLSGQFCHLTHGYVTTSYAAQSKTVDRVFIAEGLESFPAASREQFYVSVSRGRTILRIFTDDKEALFEAIRRSSQRVAALDVERGERDVRAELGSLTSETMAPIVGIVEPVSQGLGLEREMQQE